MFSTIGDPKSSKRRYQNTSKMELFSGVGQNIKIMLPLARGLTFRGSSHSKNTSFWDSFSMPVGSPPETLFFQPFDQKRDPRGYPKPLKNKPKTTLKTNPQKKHKKQNLSSMGTGSAINYESLANICKKFPQTLT